jgi:hypothetical protein
MNFSRNRKGTPSFMQPISKSGDDSISPERETEPLPEKKINYEFIDLYDWESDSESSTSSRSSRRSKNFSSRHSNVSSRESVHDRSSYSSDSYTESSDEDEPEFSDFVPIKFISEGAFGQVRNLNCFTLHY